MPNVQEFNVQKRDLVVAIAYKMQVKQQIVRDVVDRFLDAMRDALSAGKRLEFREFGVFEVVERKPKIGRNPKTGQAVPIPARRRVKFKMGRLLRRGVESLSSGSSV